MYRSWPAFVVVLVVVGAALLLSSAAAPPTSIESKLAQLERTIPVPYGAPGQAQLFHNAKRMPLDPGMNTREAYARAEAHAGRMPIFSLGGDRFLTRAEARAARPGSDVSVLRGDWEALGPDSAGGRIRTIVIDPDDPGTMYTAGVSGGVWKTSGSGGHGGLWRPLGEDMANIAVNAMAMNPSDSNTLIVGTGEGYFREDVRGTGLPLRGGGIFRTSTAGRRWEYLPATAGEDFWFVNDLVYTADGLRIYAATRTGVHRSSDGGDSWQRIFRSKENGGCLDLAIRTDRAEDVLFASCGTFEQASIYRSADAGARQGRRVRFRRVLRDSGMGRTSIAIAPSDQDVIYALSASNRSGRYEQALHAVFRSDSGGAPGSWKATVRNTDAAAHNTWMLHNAVLLNLTACNFDGANTVLPMGWYVNALVVDPVDPDRVWAGGVDWFRSSDGGRSWGPASYWWSSEARSNTHADQHVMVFHPDYDGVTNQTVFIGNDGGFWQSPNAAAPIGGGPTAVCNPGESEVEFYSQNWSLKISQFYHGLPFSSGEAILGGTQDNGTYRVEKRRGKFWGWRRVFGGDGGYVAVDPERPDVWYVESQNGNLARTLNGGATMLSATNGLPPGSGQFLDPGGNFLFITPFVMDPANSDRLWIGGRQMYRTDNMAASWQPASTTLKGRASAVAVAPANSARVAAGTEVGFVYVTDAGNTVTGSSQWGRSRPRKGWVTWVAFDPADSDVLYATYGGFGGKHVYRSSDGGQRWTAIDGTGAEALPDIPVHVVVVDPDREGRLYLGTDLGLFVTQDGGATWAQENAGFGNIVTESLHLQREGQKRMLYAFTHGRGAWRVRLR